LGPEHSEKPVANRRSGWIVNQPDKHGTKVSGIHFEENMGLEK